MRGAPPQSNESVSRNSNTCTYSCSCAGGRKGILPVISSVPVGSTGMGVTCESKTH